MGFVFDDLIKMILSNKKYMILIILIHNFIKTIKVTLV
jgi:hypothetical protein